MSEKLNREGEVVIFGGANGAGKDTSEANFRQSRHDVERIVRHITRIPAPGETDGVDYYFVNDEEFNGMSQAGEFVEFASYPGVMSGTSLSEIKNRVNSARYATATTNFEDGLLLHRRLQNLGFVSVCLFISPCSEETMIAEPDVYRARLLSRMQNRGRTTDHLEGRLMMAGRYREQYLNNRNDVHYIDNSDGAQELALGRISQILDD